MSYEFYKVLHLTGIIMIFTSLGAALLHSMNGGERKYPHRKWVMISHGIGMAMVLVAGFGLLARLGLKMEGWAIAKLAIWLYLGGVMAIIYRKPKLSKHIWLAIVLAGAVAAWLANAKPF